ncbi:AAA family ATPase [Croceicoccus ponticola]|nr:AAA family ATPase [Croceicoccus ponticola]
MNRNLPSGIYFVVQPQHAAALRAALGDAVVLIEAAPGDEIPFEVIRKASVLVLEVDPAQAASLARVSQIRAARPSMPVIVALEAASLSITRTLIRQGISDVATLPFDMTELVGQLLEISAKHAPANDLALAPMVSLVRAAGGVGATTIITHLAEALADCHGRSQDVCVIDLDLQFGQVANYLGIHPARTVLDLLEASERLDPDMVRDAAMATPQGISVIAAPTVIAPLEEVDVDRLLNLLKIARQSFDFVLVDLPSNWTNWTLSAALACNEILVVTDQSITGLRQTKRVIELFDMMNVSRENVRVVVNRVEKKLFQTIGVNEVADTLSREVSATIARDKGDLQIAQDRGVLLSDTNRKASFVKDIDRLADQICDRVVGN